MIQGQVITVLKLANVAAGKVFPTFEDVDETTTDYVIVRRPNNEPIMTMLGREGLIHSTFVFECWSTSKASAMTIAAAVDAAIDADTTLPYSFPESPSGEDFAPEVMQVMEPRQFSIWHR